MKVILFPLFALLAGWFCPLLGADSERAVVQLQVFSQEPRWNVPWQFKPMQAASGSGFVIAGKRIMTNAHVVSWAKQIIVRRHNDPRPYLARPLFIAHDCDLAVLTVDDPSFFDGIEPLEFGDMPTVRSTVVTYGYPAGGMQISYTRGVVSRIEEQIYTHNQSHKLLAVQTDAAINPGNSGGPVMQDDKVVGVAFQGIKSLENTGFFIPPPVINHMLKDIEDYTYDGFPTINISLFMLQNQDYRAYLNMPDNEFGALVNKVYPFSPALDLLYPDDVILQIGEYPVANDGTVDYFGNRVSCTVVLQDVQNGESQTLKVWRSGKEIEVRIPMKVIPQLAPAFREFTLPRYYIYGGLIFTPLTMDYFDSVSGNLNSRTRSEFITDLFYRKMNDASAVDKEPIVMVDTLDNAVNADFTVPRNALVSEINGKPINNLEDVIKAFENNPTTIDCIRFSLPERMECIDRAAAQSAKLDILTTYHISSDRRL